MTVRRPWEGRVLPDDPKRCDHDLLACRRCATVQPGVNRHWPQGPTPPRESSNRPRFIAFPNRADVRAAGRRRTAGRGRRRRAMAAAA